MELKRDNWTNEEIITLLKDYIDEDNPFDADFTVQNIVHMFEDFKRPKEESGAKAYSVELNQIFHIGPLLPRK